MSTHQDTGAKALRFNLDPSVYGAFAEIGGGQEVSRWFFRVGGASGTIAKTISAYDRTVSQALYGQADRAVSRERLREMLAYEYQAMSERLAPSRGDRTRFFVFADTVATRSHEGNNECHGWIGVQFQHAPGSPTSDMVIHASFRDPDADRQQESLGILGVNLLFAVIFERENPRDMLRSLLDGLSLDNIEVDVVEATGPAWEGLPEPLSLAADLIELGLARAVMIDERGRQDQPSFILHKRPLLLHRSSLTRDNPTLERMVAAASAMLSEELKAPAGPPLAIIELSLESALHEQHHGPAHAAARLRQLIGPRHAVMLTRWAETYELTRYIRRYSAEPLRFIVGLDIVVQMLRRHFYNRIDGGLLEGLGHLLAPNVRVYVFSMPAQILRQRLRLYETEEEFCPVPDKAVITLADLNLAPPAGRLLEYLRDTGWLVRADDEPPPKRA